MTLDRETAEAAPEADEAPVRDVRRTKADPTEVAPTAPRRKRKPLTEEQRERKRERDRGRVCTEEQMERRRERQKMRVRRPLTPEQRRRKSEKDMARPRLTDSQRERRRIQQRERRASDPDAARRGKREWLAANPPTAEQKARAVERAKRWCGKNRERAREHRRNNEHLRRSATIRGERVCLAYLRARDRSVCQICGFPVPPEARHPHPLSATLDHIVPLRPAKGATHPPGEHVKRNCRLAHLRCNVKRGNRYRGEPMLDLDESGRCRTRKESP